MRETEATSEPGVRYTFSLSDEIRQGAFHPLRELEEIEQEEAQDQGTETPPEETIA